MGGGKIFAGAQIIMRFHQHPDVGSSRFEYGAQSVELCGWRGVHIPCADAELFHARAYSLSRFILLPRQEDQQARGRWKNNAQ